MNRSLFVGLRRLLSLKLYWIVLLGGVLIYAGYASSEPNIFNISHYTLFLFCPVAVISSLFTAYLVGTDYSDGMLRNRLIIGCERWRVYLSWMVVGLIGAFIIYFSGFMITLAIGLSKDHAFPMETKLYLWVSGFDRAGGIISDRFRTGGKEEQSADLVCFFECCHGFGCLCSEKPCWCHRNRNRCL